MDGAQGEHPGVTRKRGNAFENVAGLTAAAVAQEEALRLGQVRPHEFRALRRHHEQPAVTVNEECCGIVRIAHRFEQGIEMLRSETGKDHPGEATVGAGNHSPQRNYR